MGGGRESGQATVEWIGLLAAVGLALGALAGALRGEPAKATSLGDAIAERITCATRDRCAAAAAPGLGRLRFPPPPEPPPGVRPSKPWERPPRRGDLGDLPGLPRLRRVTRAVRHGWIICFGVRSLQYDLDHPRSPREAMPPRDAVKIVNDCLNPWEFVFGD